MKKVYIVSANDAIEAVEKVKAFRSKSKDAPVDMPTPANLEISRKRLASELNALTQKLLDDSPLAFYDKAEIANTDFITMTNYNANVKADFSVAWYANDRSKYADIKAFYDSLIKMHADATAKLKDLKTKTPEDKAALDKIISKFESAHKTAVGALSDVASRVATKP